MKKYVWSILLACSMAVFTAGCGSADRSNDKAPAGENANTDQDKELEDTDRNDGKTGEETDEEVTPSQTHTVEIEIQDYGTITVALDADHAPITVANFVKLAGEGFYDGLTFHRIIEGFMMQGGDPEGNGTGGSDEKITGEFSSNDIDNPLSHTKGALSMARSQDPDSASSQFFIVHEDSLYLDGEYAVFGYVTDGQDIVDEICKNTPVEDTNGTVDTENQPVITSVKIIE